MDDFVFVHSPSSEPFLVYKGWLKKKAEKGWNPIWYPRYFELTSDGCMNYSTTEDMSGKRGCINIDKMSELRCVKEDTSVVGQKFNLITPTRVYELFCEDMSDLLGWMKSIAMVRLKMIHNSSDLATVPSFAFKECYVFDNDGSTAAPTTAPTTSSSSWFQPPSWFPIPGATSPQQHPEQQIQPVQSQSTPLQQPQPQTQAQAQQQSHTQEQQQSHTQVQQQSHLRNLNLKNMIKGEPPESSSAARAKLLSMTYQQGDEVSQEKETTNEFTRRKQLSGTLVHWINCKLLDLGEAPIDNLSCLGDGVTLVHLAQSLVGQRPPDVKDFPENLPEKKENVNLALSFICSSLEVQPPALSVEALVFNSNNLKYQVDFCWDLFLNSCVKRFYYESIVPNNPGGPIYIGLSALLHWVREHTALRCPTVQIRDFCSSFDDGLALCALVEDFCPDEIQFDNLIHVRVKENVTKAMHIAKNQFDIPPLDPTSFGRNSLISDEIVVYLACCFTKMKQERNELGL